MEQRILKTPDVQTLQTMALLCLVMCCVRVPGPCFLEYECQRKGELGDEKYSSPMGLVSTILCTIVNHQSSQQPIGSCALEAANMILF